MYNVQLSCAINDIYHLFLQIPGNQKLLQRTPSEQNIYDNLKSKMNQLIGMKPPR